ncbi:MAG: efflux RND transporter periplasmic adaptor subunit [Fuerstiella sp.]
MKTVAIIISFLAVIGVTGTWLALPDGVTTSQVDGQTPISEQAEEPLPVVTEQLRPLSSVARERWLAGTIVAARRTRLAFERSARLMSVAVDEGDHVEVGQVVAELDQRQLRHRVTELEAGLRQQQAILKELKAGPRKERIAAVRAELAAMKFDIDLQQATLKRTQDLHDRRATSTQTLDEVQLAMQAAVARRDAVSKQLDELLAGTRDEQVVAQEAVVAGMEAQLEQLRLDTNDSQLKSPYAGTVVRRLADEGDFLNSQQPVLELIESGHLEAQIGVPTQLICQVQTEEYVRLSAHGREFTGTVERVVPQVDAATRTQTVIIGIDNAVVSGLADGQLVRLCMEERQAVEGFRVPLTALASASRGLWSLYTVQPEAASDRPGEQRPGKDRAASGRRYGVLTSNAVEVLYTDTESAVVRGTVRAGDRIVSSGVHRVVPGQRVQWQADAAATAGRE